MLIFLQMCKYFDNLLFYHNSSRAGKTSEAAPSRQKTTSTAADSAPQPPTRITPSTPTNPLPRLLRSTTTIDDGFLSFFQWK